MTINDKNNGLDEKLHIFSQIKPRYSKSAQEVWQDIENKIEVTEVYKIHKTPVIRLVFRYAIASAILIFIGIGAFMRLYTINVNTTKGQHTELLLPDQSKVELNAFSKVSFHPYWWSIKREVKLQGEAFFQVKKGEQFTVKSGNINTSVLGTSFNVYSRRGKIQVACVSGKVKVTDQIEAVVLSPNEKVNYIENKLLSKETFETEKEVNSWISSEYYYESALLSDVFYDLELQFNIEIDTQNIDLSELKYSGYYKKNHSIENVLNLVCKPFGLKYENTDKGKYRLYYDK